MTKQEKEIFHGILERSGEKKANPTVIAAALAQLFPDNAEEMSKELEKGCDCDKEEEELEEIERIKKYER